MLLGLRNDPGTFQQTMDVVLTTVKWQLAIVYFNAIVVFFRSAAEHIYHVKHVLTLLLHAGVTLNVTKSNFPRKSSTIWATSFAGGVWKLRLQRQILSKNATHTECYLMESAPQPFQRL